MPPSPRGAGTPRAGHRSTRRRTRGIAPRLQQAGLLATLLKLPLDVDLDGHAVTVPAGHVRGVVSLHGSTADDHVLLGLVHRVAQMDVSVGVGRAVVEHPALPTRAQTPELSVQIGLLPAGEHLRLALGQVGPHREIRAREIEGLLVVLLLRRVGHQATSTGVRRSASSNRPIVSRMTRVIFGSASPATRMIVCVHRLERIREAFVGDDRDPEHACRRDAPRSPRARCSFPPRRRR